MSRAPAGARRRAARASSEDALAARGHARRRPRRRRAAPHRGLLPRAHAARWRSTPRCGSRSTASRCCRRWPTWRGRLVDEFDVKARAAAAAGGRARRAQLDLVWTGQAMSTETVMSLGERADDASAGADQRADACATSCSATAASSGSSATARATQAFFRFLLPLADARGEAERRMPRRCARQPARVLRLRPLRQPARATTRSTTGAWSS